jgi:hypothetical protein
VRTEGEFEAELRAALDRPDELVFIEVIFDRNDATDALKRIGAAVRKESE